MVEGSAPAHEDSGAPITDSAGAEPAFTAVAPDDGQDLELRSTAADGEPSAAESQTNKALTGEAPTPVSEQDEPAVFDEEGASSTSIWWRVLEAAVGVLAVAFLGGLALRRRTNRRDLD